MLNVLCELLVEELFKMAWGLALLGGSKEVKSAVLKGIDTLQRGSVERTGWVQVGEVRGQNWEDKCRLCRAVDIVMERRRWCYYM